MKKNILLLILHTILASVCVFCFIVGMCFYIDTGMPIPAIITFISTLCWIGTMIIDIMEIKGIKIQEDTLAERLAEERDLHIKEK